MRLKTRERVMRMFLASLLDSDLSIRELKEVANDFTGQTFSWEFGKLVHEIIEHLDTTQLVKQLSSHPDELDEFAYQLVQRRRIPKIALLDVVRSISPAIHSHLSTKSTVRDILSEFLILATQKETDNFMTFLEGENRGDAYLKGIMKRG